MTPNTRLYNRFRGYSAADCDCKYCLYNGGKRKGCLLSTCCCLEERIQAGCVLINGADGYRHPKS